MRDPRLRFGSLLRRCVPPRGLVLRGLAAVALCAAGCSQPAQRKHSLEAQERWNQVRAHMKYQLACQQYRGGAVESSIRALEEAIALDPRNAEYLVLLGQARLEGGEPAAARQAIEQAARVAPDRPDVLYMQAVVAERDHDLERAIELYRRAGGLDPTAIDCLVGEVECLVGVGRAEEASAVLEDRAVGFEGDPTLEALRAEVALLLGDEATALAGLQMAMQSLGSCEPLEEDYGLLAARLGRYEEAIHVLESLSTRRGSLTSELVVRALASAYLATGRPHEARRVLTELVRERPDSPINWLVLTRVALASGDLPGARRYAEESARRRPNDPLLHVLVGYVCWKQGEPSAAREALESALRLAPDDGLALGLMGLVCRDSDDRASARGHLSRAVQIDPGCGWARLVLDELEAVPARAAVPAPAPNLVEADRSADVRERGGGS